MSEVFWRHTNTVAEILDDTCTPNGVLTWLTAYNASLGGMRPVDLIDAGRADEVIAEARRVAA